MSNGTIDLRGNTNFVVLKNLLHQEVVPRTNLAAVDLTVANGLAITGNTLYTNLATSEDLEHATLGHLVDASVLGPILDSKQATLTAGDLIDITGGTINRKRYMSIISDSNIATRSITPTGATSAVNAFVLEPGNAYKVHVASTAKWFATTADFKSSSETWGIEGHIELFVAGTGYVHTDDNVVLATALEPDAVNNCTVRFHDGKAIISVEDTIAGYVVTVAGGTEGTSTGGSLYYGLASNVGEYISVDGSLSGTVLDLSGVTTYNAEKHVVGNGYNNTVISGAITCANKTTFSNLSVDGVVVAGGTMTFGDVYIPNGATVSVSGGGLAVEKVTGNGGVIDLGSTRFVSIAGGAVMSGVEITNGRTNDSNAIMYLYANKFTFSDCVFSYNSSTDANGALGGVLNQYGNTDISLTGCTFTSNYTGRNGGGIVQGPLKMTNCTFSGNNQNAWFVGGTSGFVSGCTFGANQGINVYASGAAFAIIGSNVIDRVAGSGSVTISSGAIVDLTGNSNATPIAPGGGITFEQGGATVYPSAGSAAAAMIGCACNAKVITSTGGLASGCSIKGGGTMKNATFSDGTINISTTELVTFDSCQNGGGNTYFTFGDVSAVNIAFKGQITNLAFRNLGTSTLRNVTLFDNFVLNLTPAQSATWICYATFGGTLTLGSNCSINNGGTVSLINGGTAGTFTNCNVLADGTIQTA